MGLNNVGCNIHIFFWSGEIVFDLFHILIKEILIIELLLCVMFEICV